MSTPDAAPENTRRPALARKLGLGLLTFYGLGNILGAGIYVLVGKVAGEAGYYTPLAFLLAAMVAGITALTYAELSSRFPYAAGEAIYLKEGFGMTWLSTLTGLLIAMAGMLSAATISRGFVGYLEVFVGLPDTLALTLLLLTLGLVAVWGIAESIKVAALFTAIEMAGLALIIVVAFPDAAMLEAAFAHLPPPTHISIWPGILTGAFLAFYAFIGFEDMVNVAEEVRDPSRNMPRAIFLALGIATLLYGLVGLVAIVDLDPQRLAASDAPLALVYEQATGKPPVLISMISMFAVINGALIQIIMAARVFYGMSKQGWLPAFLARVSPRTRTPSTATLIVVALILALALWFPLLSLAKYTSYLILVIFLLVNLALLRIRKTPPPAGVTTYPVWVPLGGALGAIFLLSAQIMLG